MINLRTLLSLAFALSILAVGVSAVAQHHGSHGSAAAVKGPSGKLVEITVKEAAWAAEASKAYPLTVCVVSEEKLGSMGDATEWIYRAEGQPDRLVKFCCDGCIDTFMDNPAEHLAKIDAAARKKAAKK